MQTTTWSNDEVRQQFANCATLREVIQNLEKKAWDSGQIVCEVKINGIVLSENEENQFAETLTQSIGTLEILTRTPSELVNDAVRSYQDFIPEIKTASLECSEKFREQNVYEASQQFSGVLEGCRWFTDAVVLLKSNADSWLRQTDLNQKWNLCELGYTKIVKELLGAFEAKDYTLIADLLEYELTNCLDAWSSLFEDMRLAR